MLICTVPPPDRLRSGMTEAPARSVPPIQPLSREARESDTSLCHIREEISASSAVVYLGPAGGDTEPVAISPLSIATAPHCLDLAFASNRPSAT